MDEFAAVCARLNVHFTPLLQDFGVEVCGLDLTQPLGEQRQVLLEALDRHDALLFRGQPLTPADEQRTMLYFSGDPEVCSGFGRFT